eukprot:PhM_4_TR16154/c1_g1_i1/m.43344
MRFFPFIMVRNTATPFVLALPLSSDSVWSRCSFVRAGDTCASACGASSPSGSAGGIMPCASKSPPGGIIMSGSRSAPPGAALSRRGASASASHGAPRPLRTVAAYVSRMRAHGVSSALTAPRRSSGAGSAMCWRRCASALVRGPGRRGPRSASLLMAFWYVVVGIVVEAASTSASVLTRFGGRSSGAPASRSSKRPGCCCWAGSSPSAEGPRSGSRGATPSSGSAKPSGPTLGRSIRRSTSAPPRVLRPDARSCSTDVDDAVPDFFERSDSGTDSSRVRLPEPPNSARSMSNSSWLSARRPSWNCDVCGWNHSSAMPSSPGCLLPFFTVLSMPPTGSMKSSWASPPSTNPAMASNSPSRAPAPPAPLARRSFGAASGSVTCAALSLAPPFTPVAGPPLSDSSACSPVAPLPTPPAASLSVRGRSSSCVTSWASFNRKRTLWP